MQYLLTEEEYKNLCPYELYRKMQSRFDDASRQLEAFGKAVNEHPDGERIWERQREILRLAQVSDPELFNNSAMLLSEVDYGVAEYAEGE